jgi:hypothetical protein
MVERFKFMIITTIIFALPSCDLDKHHLLTSQVTNRKGVSMLLLKFITVQVRVYPSWAGPLVLCSSTRGSWAQKGRRHQQHRGLYHILTFPSYSAQGGC